MDDAQLLQQYVQTGSSDAFAALVNRHVHFVYAAAYRHVRNTALAEDVTQAVFIVLSRKAATLRHEAVLSSWLLSTTRFAALSAMKAARRRQRHEQKVAEMQSQVVEQPDPEAHWAEIREMLDAGLSKLRESDRRAILLRYYERKSFAEIGAILGTAEEAARKRVSRAVDQLRGFFAKSGEVVPSVLLGTLLFTRMAPPAPAGVAERVSRVCRQPPIANPGAQVLSRQILQNIAIARTRRLLSYVAASVLLAAVSAGAILWGREQLKPPPAEPQPSATLHAAK